MTAAQESSLRQARTKAAATGKPVVVDALTDETSTTTANPAGTLTRSSTLLPTRVRKNGTWIPLDATLVRNADGTYSPKASSIPLRLSGGASVPLAVMTAGKARLAFRWPAKLPAPTVSGAGLTYRDVLPGVDLKLTATALGGFSEILVVKSAAAATNPALASLTMATHTTGLTVRKDAQQNLDAVTANGEIAFSASRPIMWDSARAAGAGAPRVLASGPTASAADPAATGTVPGPGAHIAYVGTRLGGGSLALSPDRTLLTGPRTVFPLYIDPTWNPHPASGSRQHFNEVQQACPSTSETYDSTKYGDPGVGNNTYSGCVGLERSYFQLSVPSNVLHSHIVSAKINVMETYAAQCATTSTVNMYLTRAINSPFSWNNRPAPGTFIDSASFAPACTSYVSNSFEATSIVARAAAGGWSSLAYVLINGNESNGYHFKRFAANPTMNITYNHVPNLPGSLALKLNNSTYNCATSAPYPILGKTVATTPPSLTSVVSDADRDALQAKYAYWVGGATASTMYSADVSSGQRAPATFPSGYITGLADGSIVNWRVSVSDGEDSAGTTATTCRFVVDRRAPAEPSAVSNNNIYPDIDNGGGPGAAAGTAGTFTAKVDPGTTNNNATTFVFGLDAAPPTSGAPASQTVAAVNNAASYKVTPVAPGTHTLYVYALDEAGNESPMHEYHFTAVGHTGKTYTSLSAAFNNTAVSSNSATSAANADGSGTSYSLQDLQAAGWQPGGKVTVDGATFTLPSFGTGSPDNVLAANQTITMNGQQGSALVFLAASTYGGSASDHVPSDHSSPYVPDGTDISATNCQFESNRYSDCSEASGTVALGDGTTQSYYLAVPDWHTGPFGLEVAQFPHANSPSGQTSLTQRIYAFAVPLPQGASVSSVTLPDLSDTARAHVPGLHIFGIAVRDTTTAPGGAKWTGAWSSPSETGAWNYQGGANYTNQTFRIAVRPSVTGSGVRIKLSNRGGFEPITIYHTTLATQSSGAVPTATPTDLTFSGSKTVTLPIGSDSYSDPLTLPVTANHPVLISFHIANSVTHIPEHSWASATVMYVGAPGGGDHTADTTEGAFTGTGTIHGTYASDLVTGLDVTTAGNVPTVVTLGDGLIDPFGTGTHAIPGFYPEGATWRLANSLASALQSNTQGVPHYGVVAGDIPNNEVATDQAGSHNGNGGDALLSRLDEDVLTVPNVTTVVVNQGLRDIVTGADDSTVTDAFESLLDQLNAFGIRVVFATLTPCDGYAGCTPTADENRQLVNIWMSNLSAQIPPGVASADTNAAVAVDDPASTATPPEQQLSAQEKPLDFDTGDHINLTVDGFAAVATTLTSNLAVLTPPLPAGP